MVITEEHVMALFDEANPVRDLDAQDLAQVDAASYLTTLSRRSIDMTELEAEGSTESMRKRQAAPVKPPDTKRRNGLLVAAAAVVAVLVAVGVVAAVATVGDEPDVADTPTTMIQSATTTTAASTETTTEPSPVYPGERGGDLAGTRWSVFSFMSHGELFFKPVDWPMIILEFGYDGTISGTGGCNDYQADFEVTGDYNDRDGASLGDIASDGQLLTFDRFTATETVCPSAELMEQEAEYLARLADVGRWWINPKSELTLVTEDGARLMGALPRPQD